MKTELLAALPRPRGKRVCSVVVAATSLGRNADQGSGRRPVPSTRYRAGLDNTHISAHYGGVRRKSGTLIPLELAICETAIKLRHRGTSEFHGYSIAKAIKHQSEARLLTAYGTLYRALDRLQKMGLLESRKEDPQIAADEGRPGRRLYKLTAAGESAVTEARKAAAARAARIRERAKKPAPA